MRGWFCRVCPRGEFPAGHRGLPPCLRQGGISVPIPQFSSILDPSISSSGTE